MSEYLEIFRAEAKSLLKKFRNNEENAVAQCRAVFGSKADLSLMNIQHVTAKKYGFNHWNELTGADNAQLAEALINAKNSEIGTPFPTWADGKKCSFFEDNKQILKTERKNLDLVNFKEIMPNGNETEWLRLQHLDLSSYNLSCLNPLYATYSDDTIWPQDNTMLPNGFEPKKFLEERKNPGLGIRALHAQGLDGKGRAAAIIDWQTLRDHLEYHHNLKGYTEIHQQPNFATTSDGALVSALAGRTCGLAPNADVYYYSADNDGRTQRYYAQALNKVCDLHIQLKRENTTGIDVVCILFAVTLFKNDDGADEMAKALARAEELGIWVNSGHVEIAGKSWKEKRLHCRVGGDLENPDDYTLFSREQDNPAYAEDLQRNTLCFPGGGRTVANEDRLNAYGFSAPGFYLKPYECGLYMLAKSIKENLTPLEFWQTGLNTGDFRKNIGMIINPQRLIEALKK